MYFEMYCVTPGGAKKRRTGVTAERTFHILRFGYKPLTPRSD